MEGLGVEKGALRDGQTRDPVVTVLLQCRGVSDGPKFRSQFRQKWWLRPRKWVWWIENSGGIQRGLKGVA
jgi:hypothetical protein